jgi:hypothetical protein
LVRRWFFSERRAASVELLWIHCPDGPSQNRAQFLGAGSGITLVPQRLNPPLSLSPKAEAQPKRNLKFHCTETTPKAEKSPVVKKASPKKKALKYETTDETTAVMEIRALEKSILEAQQSECKGMFKKVNTWVSFQNSVHFLYVKK